jgi:hypothetical protein
MKMGPAKMPVCLRGVTCDSAWLGEGEIRCGRSDADGWRPSGCEQDGRRDESENGLVVEGRSWLVRRDEAGTRTVGEVEQERPAETRSVE